MRRQSVVLAAVSFVVAAPAIAIAQSALPEVKRQPSAQAVLDEHMDALNHCDWSRILAQYPDDAQINLPGGAVVSGRKAIGEMPLDMDLIDRALRKADLFVAIGTLGAVYPAAGFVAEARAYGLRTCEINLEAADNADLFDEQRLGPASETVPAWVEEVVGGS